MEDRHSSAEDSLAPSHINPFVHKVEFSLARKVQVFLMSLTIAPLRLICIMLFTVVAYVVACVFTIGQEMEAKKPVPRWRRISIFIIQPLMRLVFFFMGVIWIEQKGKPASSEEAFVYAIAPHSTFYDAVPCTDIAASVVAKKEIMAAPFLGTMMKTLQPVLVLRPDPQSRQDTIEEIQRRAAASENWPQVLIFPEGTCTNRKALITFKGGAFIPGVAVQPIVLRYPNTWDTYTWTMNGPNAFALLWLSLCQFYIRYEIEYLPVYYPSEQEKQDPKLYAENVRRIMGSAMGVPSTDHTFEDCRLMYQAQSYDLPLETGLVEFSKLNRQLGTDIDEMKMRLAEFASASRACKDGLMGLEEFARHLDLPVTGPVKELFRFYDRNGSGLLNFRDYIIGTAKASDAAVTEKTVKHAFKVFDADRDQYVSKEELTHVLKSVFGPDFSVEKIFAKIETKNQGKMDYEEFYALAKKRPEYAKLFLSYVELAQEDVLSSIRSLREKYRNARPGTSCRPVNGQGNMMTVRCRKLITN